MAIYSTTVGQTPTGLTINDSRRELNFGERISELNPAASPFFAYLSKVAKKPTDDPVFKFLEKRHQWQRRNFKVNTAVSAKTWASDADLAIVTGDDLYLSCEYDKYGRKPSGDTVIKPEFLTVGQVIAVQGLFKNEAAAESGSAGTGFTSGPVIVYYKITALADSDINRKDVVSADYIKAVYIPGANRAAGTNTSNNVGVVSFDAADTLEFEADAPGQVVGTAHAEGSGAPDGWRDEFYTNEGYAQIFKTSVPLFSGTSMATRYRGESDEFVRVYQEKLMEHKMDIENAMLFGYGMASDTVGNASPGDSSTDTRKTWGILPYTEINGQVKQFTYASSGYDDFVDAMSDIFDAESGAGGNKLVLASRSIMNWLNKLGGTSFLGNTMAYGDNPFNVDVSKGASMFEGVNVTKVDTLYGTLNFVMEPLLRGPWVNHAVAIDMANVAYRPLAANGKSRDTFVKQNIQGTDVDGRKDMILTEAGLEISLPETHAVLKFS